MSVSIALTWLFVPGDRPERFEKAGAVSVDGMVIDRPVLAGSPRQRGADR
ncbi:hypothetical protein [Nocardia vaccinii]|nr:hypothetical protein [Nocardia vaccinii]